MPRSTHENTRVYFLTTIDDIDAPTSAEIAAGTDLTDQVPVDGLALSGTSNNASQAMLGDAFVAEQVGTWGRTITLTVVRDDTDDTARDLFTYRLDGFLVISRFGVPATGDMVEVYPVECHEPTDLPTAENEYQKSEVQMAVTAKPSLRAEVDAAS